MTIDSGLRVGAHDLPALFRDADDRAARAQATFLLLIKLQIFGLLAVAGLSTISVSIGESRAVDLIVAVVAAVLILLRVLSRSWRSEKTWYQARASAESIKTISWRFMMRATPFDGEDADQVFLTRLREMLAELPDQPIVPLEATAPQLTPKMLSIRNAPIRARMAIYARDRVDDQAAWYARRARYSDRRSRGWNGVMLGLLVLGLVLALLKIAGDEMPLLALITTGVATVSTWIGARNFESMAAAYAMAAHELSTIRAQLDLVPPTNAAWSGFVNDAEEAISREHTSWFASRQR